MKSPITGTWTVKSTNNGQTWGSAISGVNGGDRNTMACDQTNGPFANYIYQAMTSSSFNSANFARSTNGGASFTQTFTGTPHNLPGVMIAVGPNGTVQGGSVYFVTYSGSNSNGTYNFFLSTNGGASFTFRSSLPGIGLIGTEIGGRSTINGIRTRPYPMIAADNSYGPFRGRLYLVWANNDPPGNGNRPDIFLRYSTDQGLNWSSPVKVNDNANPTATNQWFPAIWCDKINGKLWIKWYDMRNDPNNVLVDVYGTWTTNGGTSFVANQRITNMSWNYPGPVCPGTITNYRGDYDAISANSTTSLSVWYDARNSNCGNYVGYFPDFAMTALPPTMTLNGINDSGFVRVSVPGVKLYTDKAKFSASITPNPGSGTITMTFLNRSTPALQDSLTTYPDSLRLRIKTSGGVTQQSYTITITGKGSNGTPIHKRTVTLSVITGIVSNNSEIPQNFYLYQNFPNPFNPSTNIRFDLPKTGNVKLTVYDITGKQLTVLVNENLSAGKYTVDFDAFNVSSGIYFYKIETPGFTSIRKMILVK
jgi:methionine-rich copper-binding protein CopC